MGAPIQLDYGRPGRFARFSWGRLRRLALASVVAGYLLLTFSKPTIRTSISVCKKCGAEEKITVDCFSYTSIPFSRTRVQYPTPLSSVVAKHQLHYGHSHQFVLGITYSGHDSELGPAFCVMSQRGAAHARFIDTLARYSDRATAEFWLDRFLTRDLPWHSMKIATDPPPENQAEFNQWWRFAILDDFTTLNDGMPGGKSPDKLSKP